MKTTQTDEMKLHRLYWIPTAIGTDRSTLDLLTIDWPFSQLPLLNDRDFAKEAEKRGIRIDSAGLEELHRRGILVPFYRVDLGEGGGAKIPTSDFDPGSYSRSTILSELYMAADEGRVVDPGAVPFKPWPFDRWRTLWPSVESGYLYSSHQLLALDHVRGIVDDLVPERKGPNEGLNWRLPDEAMPDESSLDALRRWRSLAVLLASFDSVFWPEIRHVVSHSAEAWRTVRLRFDAAALISWLGVTEEEIVKQAEDLLLRASSQDVLGDFYDLVRRAKPAAWDSMRGSALAAMDSRLRAELLCRLADLLRPAPAPHPQRRLEDQRLSERPELLDTVLMRLQVSPHPTVVLALEGATEMGLMPQVFDLLGIPLDSNLISMVDFGGTSKDLSLLARFAAEPRLGIDHGEYVSLARPVTRFVVLTDAENKYATKQQRDRQRELLLKSIIQDVPKDLRADLRGPDAHLVDIMTWGKHPFEFAHFTDRQLAQALISASSQTHPGGVAGLTQAVAAERATGSPNIKDAWPAAGVSKPKLADELWPVLRRKIERAIASHASGPPIMQGAIRAYELAMREIGRSIVLRRDDPPVKA